MKNCSSFWIIFLIILVAFSVTYSVSAGSTSMTISATILSVCGDDVVEDTEQCDGSDLNSQTCQGFGYTGGTLNCNNDCTFYFGNCTSGGGGGGTYTPPPAKERKVIIKGKAYPSSMITILQDGKVVVAGQAVSEQASFSIEITDLTAGIYTFGIWAEDTRGLKSITFNFTTSIAKNTITTIGGIFVPPTIELSEMSLRRGETLNILGQTIPNSEVSIIVHSTDEGITKKTIAEDDGTWFYALDTSVLEEGQHTSRAKSVSPEGLPSSFSKVMSFFLGNEETVRLSKLVDINKDSRVDLIDFSILLYNWGIPKSYNTDLDNNGKVDIVDFSILLYYWTG